MISKMQKWWKRVIAAGLVISLFSVGLVVYPKEKKRILTLGVFAGNQWDVPDDNCYKIIDEVIDEFEKENPNVTVEYDSGILKDDYSEWISQKALEGDLPDVFMILPQDFSTFSSTGMLKNLNSLIRSDRQFDKGDYYQESYEAGKYGENQYALPYESVPTLMFVNKSLLKKRALPCRIISGHGMIFIRFAKRLPKIRMETDVWISLESMIIHGMMQYTVTEGSCLTAVEPFAIFHQTVYKILSYL